jgi:hypothetical protein
MKSTLRVLVSSVAWVISFIFVILASFSLIPSGSELWRPFSALAFASLVAWYVWRHSATPTQLLVATVLVGVPVVMIPGWGYLRASLHGTLQVSLYDIALRTERQAYGWVLAADLVFRDSTGRALARGRVDERGIVSMLHPEVGDCRREEREGEAAWRPCFDAQSRWIMTWARQVRDARVDLKACTIDHVPVQVEESRDAWWLWWVPLPHIDNSTYTRFNLTSRIDSTNCRPADR